MERAKQIGALVRSLRTARKLKQDELAAQVGVTERTISQIENGRVTTSLATLEAIAKQLGAPLWRLLRLAKELPDDERRFAALTEILATCLAMDDALLALVSDLVRAVHAYQATPDASSDGD
jgi:transcriptional regulator with XRE-family HTH domain